MRLVALLFSFLLLVFAAAALAIDPAQLPPALAPYAQIPPALAPYVEIARPLLPRTIAGLALLSFVAVLLTRSKPAPERAAAQPAAAQADAEVVSFLGLLQEKGRLVDFLMDDVAGYSDAQVGAAARVLHEGCKAVLNEHFGIRPLRAEKEGAKVTVAAGYGADEYRFIGRISGQAPFTGTLVHHGWKTEWAKLPRLIRADAGRLPAIAPAEVELG